MSVSNEPLEQLSQENQTSLGLEQALEKCESASHYDKPIIRKVDESRHGDFWCD
jgi:hypothetical protein